MDPSNAFENFTIWQIPGILEGLICNVSRLALVLMVVMIAYTGIKFALSFGNPQKFGDAKKAFLWVLIGSLVIFGVYSIILTVAGLLGFEGDLQYLPISCSSRNNNDNDDQLEEDAQFTRVIARSETEVQSATALGCVVDSGTENNSTVLMCPSTTGNSLSLDQVTRYVAESDQEIVDAEVNGCEISLRSPDQEFPFAAVECANSLGPSAVGQIGLEEDILIYPTDEAANQQIGANIAHNNNFTGEGIGIGILDTGIDYNHVELRSSYAGGYDLVDGDSDPIDLNGHGTHVAGIIAADGIDNMARGIAPDSQLYAFKIFNDRGGGSIFGWSSTLASALLRSRLLNLDIVNLSLGSSTRSSVTCDDSDLLITGVINKIVQDGMLVVIASGNEGERVTWPGCISRAITVGAVDFSDNVARFSGRGGALDITAPGVDIYSTWANNRYNKISGTSMATPVVVGSLALIKQANPGRTVNEIEKLIYDTAVDLGDPGKDTNYGWGRIDVARALGLYESTPSEGPTPTNQPPVSRQPPPIENRKSVLNPNERLNPEERLFSPDGQYDFVLQSDGNIVLYAPGERPLWSSNSQGNIPEALVMGNDGNLVLYSDGIPVWATETSGHNGAHLQIQDDGNAVIYENDLPIWSAL